MNDAGHTHDVPRFSRESLAAQPAGQVLRDPEVPPSGIVDENSLIDDLAHDEGPRHRVVSAFTTRLTLNLRSSSL